MLRLEDGRATEVVNLSWMLFFFSGILFDLLLFFKYKATIFSIVNSFTVSEMPCLSVIFFNLNIPLWSPSLLPNSPTKKKKKWKNILYLLSQCVACLFFIPTSTSQICLLSFFFLSFGFYSKLHLGFQLIPHVKMHCSILQVHFNKKKKSLP